MVSIASQYLSHLCRSQMLWRFWEVDGCGHNDIEARKFDDYLALFRLFLGHVQQQQNLGAAPPAVESAPPASSTTSSFSK
jgi:hypothetical protein